MSRTRIRATIDNAVANDGFKPGGSPLDFGLGSGTWLLLPFMMFWILYPNWGATLYGEVRGAGDFRKVLNGMLGGLWVTIILAIAFVLLASKTFGWDFFNAGNVNFINYAYGYVTVAPTIPIWGYPPMLAAFLVDNHILQMIIVDHLRGLVPRLGGDPLAVVDADDLRRRLRPRPPRTRRPCLRSGSAVDGAAPDHDPGGDRVVPLFVCDGLLQAHP